MKIFFVGPANSEHIVRWVNALTERGHKVYLASLANHPASSEINIKISIYKLRIKGMKGYYLNTIQLRRLIKKISPDIINVHYASGYGTLMRWAKIDNAILSVWGSDVYEFPYKNKICNRIIKKNLLYAKRIASTSYCMAEQIEKLIGHTKRIDITPFGIELKEYNIKKDKTTDKIIIGCVKTLEPNYGIDYLIKSIRILIDSLNEKGNKEVANKIRCKIYGNGSQKQQLENLIETEKLHDIVTLEGKIPHSVVAQKLQEMDIFVALSNKESFGVAALEASAVGLPVVLSDADGFKEVEEDGVTGIIVEKQSPMKAAEALEKLVMDEKLRYCMGTEGRKRVEERYDWNRCVDVMEELYKGEDVQI